VSSVDNERNLTTMLRCVAVCCSVLQCVAVRCSVLQRGAVGDVQCYSVSNLKNEQNISNIQYSEMKCNLQCTSCHMTHLYVT